MIVILVGLSTLNAIILIILGYLGLILTTQELSENKKKMYKKIFVSLSIFGILIIIGVGGLTIKVSKEGDRKTDNLQQSIDKMSLELDPFLKLAMKKYPNVSAAEAIEKFQNEMQQLEARTSTLEEKTTNRSLTQSQRQQLVRELSQYKGYQIAIASSLDSEAINFASTFKNIFEDAGWIVDKASSITFNNNPFFDFHINVVQEEPSLNEAKIIGDALTKIGFEVKYYSLPNTSPNKIVLEIGSKE